MVVFCNIESATLTSKAVAYFVHSKLVLDDRRFPRRRCFEKMYFGSFPLTVFWLVVSVPSYSNSLVLQEELTRFLSAHSRYVDSRNGNLRRFQGWRQLSGPSMSFSVACSNRAGSPIVDSSGLTASQLRTCPYPTSFLTLYTAAMSTCNHWMHAINMANNFWMFLDRTWQKTRLKFLCHFFAMLYKRTFTMFILQIMISLACFYKRILH